MPDTSFQDRVQRINAKNPHPSVGITPSMAPTKSSKPSYGTLFIGALIMSAGFQAIKHANEHYEEIKLSIGLGATGVLAVAGVAAFLVGVVLMFRGLKPARNRRKDVARHDTTSGASPKRIATNRARTISSILGFIFGALASFYFVLAAVARSVGTETAREFFAGAIIIMLGLCLLSLIIGLTGLFLRGFALGRVPIYFVIGALMTFAVVKLSGTNPLEWNWIVSRLV